MINDSAQPLSATSKIIQGDGLSNISVVWTIWFVACFYPLTISEFGVNYLFVLTPFFYVILGGRLRSPSSPLKIFSVLLILILIIATIYQIDYLDWGLRRIISFFIFASILSLTILRFGLREINSSLIALIIVCSFLSLESIYKLVSMGLVNTDGEQAKNEVGSQRVGFLIIFSFWAAVWYATNRDGLFRVVFFCLSGLLIAGIFLTFSRASILSFIVSGIFYLIIKDGSFSVLRLFSPFRVIIICTIVWPFFILFNFALPMAYQFYSERLFDFFVSGLVFDHLALPETSEGTRIEIWTDILSYVMRNPITGSGFLGTWIMGDKSGSAHNQYLDVLFRLGVIGFAVYSMVLWSVSKFLLKASGVLFCGFAGVLVYGIFHETFKEPGGALLLAILCSFYSAKSRV